jgi:hypothetical protein
MTAPHNTTANPFTVKLGLGDRRVKFLIDHTECLEVNKDAIPVTL